MCLYSDTKTTGRLSAGSPTPSILQNSPSCDWSLDLVNNKKNDKLEMHCLWIDFSQKWQELFLEALFVNKLRFLPRP